MLACKKRGASTEEANAILMKGLVCLTEIKAANRALCEETERVQLFILPTCSLTPLSTTCTIATVKQLSQRAHSTSTRPSIVMTARIVQVRELTAEAKAQFDTAELSLQNLLYEKRHYLKEIRACKAYRCGFHATELV